MPVADARLQRALVPLRQALAGRQRYSCVISIFTGGQARALAAHARAYSIAVVWPKGGNPYRVDWRFLQPFGLGVELVFAGMAPGRWAAVWRDAWRRDGVTLATVRRSLPMHHRVAKDEDARGTWLIFPEVPA